MSEELKKPSLLLDRPDFEALLSRFQESARHLLRADGLVLAALLTLASLFKLDEKQVLGLAISVKWPLQFLIFLMVGLILYEAVIVTAYRAEENPGRRSSAAKFYGWFYFGLVFLHCAAFVYALGYAVSFLESRGP